MGDLPTFAKIDAWWQEHLELLHNTLAQAHKLQLVGETRRRLGRTYELVWRQRPDYVSTGLRWADARRALLSSAAPGAQYVSCRERMHASDRLSPRRG